MGWGGGEGGGGGIQIYKHFNSGLIVNPLMKTTTMGTVKVYWLINLIRLINSIILCKHWRCDLSVDHFSERENHIFVTEKNLRKSLPHIFNFNQSKSLQSMKCLLWYIVPGQKT